MTASKWLGLLSVAWLAVASSSARPLTAAAAASWQNAASTPVQPASAPSQHRALITQYCVACHNARLKTAELALDTVDLATVSAHADVWEKVARKLRTGTMPPPGRRRPDTESLQAFATWIETELDRASAASPKPGPHAPFRRLTRTEYRNVIRDLLALDDLPQEMDVSLLLPADDARSGFDNVADLLFLSPTLLERYLSAAEKISRLAVGDPDIPVLVSTHRFLSELPQDVRVEDLPFGTRGGTVIRSHFPLDGDYAVKIEFAGRIRDANQIEISVDEGRAKLITVGDQPSRDAQPATDVATGAAPVEARLRLGAGPHAIGVAFIERTAAIGEQMVQPRLRGRGDLPAFASITISGPYSDRRPGDTPSRRRIFTCRPKGAADDLPCAKRILTTLARRAYRRPVTEPDLQELLTFYKGAATQGFERGIEAALERLLVSPQFLFRIERSPAAGAPIVPVSDVELASRLSFFLWSSMPDDELLNLAAQGKLSDPATLEKQVKRLLADDRSSALVTNFAAQWLFLRDLKDKRPDADLFPNFDEGLRQALLRETELFVESIVREDRSVVDLLRADYTFVNERLARHYGLPGIYGSHFRRVTLPDDTRHGLLGQGSILTLTSLGTRTSPVLRGKWILENLLAAAPPPPPPNVPNLKESSASGKALSMKEAMVQHRANPACASCHAQMDPLGFALENFDAVGRWRSLSESGQPVDVTAALPDGKTLQGVGGLRDVLLSQPQQFVNTVAEKLVAYALGRGLDFYDAPVVRRVTAEAATNDNRFSALVLGVVKSVPFQMKGKPAS